MAELTTKGRERLRGSQFAYVDSDGGEHLPIHDEAHARNAIARWNQTAFESQAAKERARKKIGAAAKRFKIEVDPDAKIATPNAFAQGSQHQAWPPGRPKRPAVGMAGSPEG